MENSGAEPRVDHATDASASPLGLLDLLITRLAEPAVVLDGSLTIVSTNDAFATLVGADDTPVGKPLTAVLPGLTAETVAETIEQSGEYVSVRIGTAPERWAEFGFDRHGTHILCVGRDRGVDRRVELQRNRTAVTNLQRATPDLLGAESREAVAECIVETATDVLGLSGATLYLFDACRNVLWPAGVDGRPGADARAPVGGADDGIVREVFLEGTATTVESGDRYQPLGDYGVLHTVCGADQRDRQDCERRPGPGDERTGGRVDRLAERAVAALGRVDREATLRERDATHREQAERVTELERELSLVRRVHRVLVDADTVGDIESGICTALTASDWLSFAWVGRVRDGGVEPRAWSGAGSDYLETVSLSTDDPQAPPAVQTVASNQPTTVDAVAEDIGGHHWCRAAIARDFQAAVSVPLRADSVSYGVLTAYADQPVEWDDSLRSVFTELGDSVATAVRDRERQAHLAADTVVELDLRVTEPDATLERLAGTLGATVCCTEAIPVDGERTRLFLTVPGFDGDAVGGAARAVCGVDSLAAVADGDRYELVAREPTVVGRVVRHGGHLDTACVTDEEMSLTVTLAADADVRAFLDRLANGHADITLTARRQQPAETRSRDGIRRSLEAVLTDRQLEALQTAYGSGFFEWPRETTGEGVAEMLGVAQPTVNRHLRVSQRKLLELVFEDVA
ncbi:helix-turn-helix domain-containing protein [Halomicroarcula sp. F28]|uniref:bacterio-opsin activator domain-containing protein n=1 Tax=Haloarcula salinisoli TaxID=2487746 RepID=UPI001C7338EE|nr:bacterio-opsin activator domain-containing protein [Halomicroarcula salinisoli]MBX0286243.1 helix-turn-helix domain-containing protein [Halomicroarcula salinisoli]